MTGLLSADDVLYFFAYIYSSAMGLNGENI